MSLYYSYIVFCYCVCLYSLVVLLIIQCISCNYCGHCSFAVSSVEYWQLFCRSLWLLQHEDLTVEKLLNKFVTLESVDDVVCDKCQCSASFVKKLTLGKARWVPLSLSLSVWLKNAAQLSVSTMQRSSGTNSSDVLVWFTIIMLKQKLKAVKQKVNCRL